MSRIVTSDYVAGALTTFRSAFQEYYAENMRSFPLEDLATVVPSTADTEDYSWLGDFPGMREFLGERVYKALRVLHYSLVNKSWEATIAIKRETFEDDGKLGTIMPRIQGLASAALRHRHKLLMQTILANGVAYDGVAMFATTHATGDSGTQSNLLTGTGVTTAQVTADFRAARAALLGYKTDTGEHFNTQLDLIVLAPQGLFGVFEELQNATLISNTTNVLKGAFKLVISPYLASLTGGDANDWYLINKVGPIKPFIFQDREAPDLVGMTNPEADHVFKYNEYLWGTKARYNTGMGLWQLAVKTTNT
jgi:phage major head subunit gpT-like protein